MLQPITASHHKLDDDGRAIRTLPPPTTAHNNNNNSLLLAARPPAPRRLDAAVLVYSERGKQTKIWVGVGVG